MTDDVPRLATLDDDGWTLINAEVKLAAGDQLYWIPSRWERDHLEEHVPDDGFVKLIFRILDSKEPREPVIERMWVSLARRRGEWYHGHLANEPHTGGTACVDMSLWFRAEHVIDYSGADGETRASERKDVLRCKQHGPSEACYVCEHLSMNTSDHGFNIAPGTDEQRPDAWCDACHSLLDSVADWDALGDRHPKIKLVCGGCYDLVRERHQRSDPEGGMA